ncbi:MAG: trypsin-like serine protease [Neomegalonema sp.]|nr:trypsin-like serine protease [Neomegalonema sp.]
MRMTRRLDISGLLACFLALSCASIAHARAEDLRDEDLPAMLCGSPAVIERPAASASGFSPTAVDPQIPWMAKLEIVEQILPGGVEVMGNCGGAVIGPRLVVTAAHCVHGADWQSIRITMGDRNVDGAKALRRTARRALCHADYRADSLDNDIALIELDAPLPADFPLLRIASADELSGLERGDPALSAGWARGKGGASMSRLLRRTPLRLVDPARVGRSGGTKMVAAPDRDRPSLCLGDSGGPLIADAGQGPALIGVFSNVDALVDPRTGVVHELCSGFEARSYFTSLIGLRGWLEQTAARMSAALAAPLRVQEHFPHAKAGLKLNRCSNESGNDAHASPVADCPDARKPAGAFGLLEFQGSVRLRPAAGNAYAFRSGADRTDTGIARDP